MATPLNDIIRSETASYLADDVDPENPPPSSTIEEELLTRGNNLIEAENVGRSKKNQPVSYTHLDVYKRQGQPPVELAASASLIESSCLGPPTGTPPSPTA